MPANFRSHLNSLGYNGFINIIFQSFSLRSLFLDRIEKLFINRSLNPFEEKRDFFATSVLSESENLQFDTEAESP